MKKQTLSKEFKIGDIITIPNSDVNLGDEGKIIKIYTDYNSIPKGDIGDYELDIDAYEEEDLNEPWYKIKQGNIEQIYSTSDLNREQNIYDNYKSLNYKSIKVEYDVNKKIDHDDDYSEFPDAKVIYAEYEDGTKLTDEELENMNKEGQASDWARWDYDMKQD